MYDLSPRERVEAGIKTQGRDAERIRHSSLLSFRAQRRIPCPVFYLNVMLSAAKHLPSGIFTCTSC